MDEIFRQLQTQPLQVAQVLTTLKTFLQNNVGLAFIEESTENSLHYEQARVVDLIQDFILHNKVDYERYKEKNVYLESYFRLQFANLYVNIVCPPEIECVRIDDDFHLGFRSASPFSFQQRNHQLSTQILQAVLRQQEQEFEDTLPQEVTFRFAYPVHVWQLCSLFIGQFFSHEHKTIFVLLQNDSDVASCARVCRGVAGIEVCCSTTRQNPCLEQLVGLSKSAGTCLFVESSLLLWKHPRILEHHLQNLGSPDLVVADDLSTEQLQYYMKKWPRCRWRLVSRCQGDLNVSERWYLPPLQFEQLDESVPENVHHSFDILTLDRIASIDFSQPRYTAHIVVWLIETCDEQEKITSFLSGANIEYNKARDLDTVLQTLTNGIMRHVPPVPQVFVKKTQELETWIYANDLVTPFSRPRLRIHFHFLIPTFSNRPGDGHAIPRVPPLLVLEQHVPYWRIWTRFVDMFI